MGSKAVANGKNVILERRKLERIKKVVGGEQKWLESS